MHPHFSLRRENRTSRLFGYVVSLTLAAGLNFLPETVALAQIQAPRQGGIPVGKFMFYPSGLLEFGRTNNVLYSSEDLGTIPSGIVIARINLLMDMPLGPHHIRWSYSPQFKDYTSDQFVNEYPISHFFNFESRFRVGRSFNIGFFDRYVRGVTELQEVDPGNELVFGLTPFKLNEASLNFELSFGARQRFMLSPRFVRSQFDDSQQALSLNYETQAITSTYLYQISPPTELFLLYALEETTQARVNLFLSEARLRTEAVGLGLNRVLNDNVITSFSMAYTEVRLDGGTATDFNGMSFELGGNWRLNDAMQVRIKAQRRPYQSFFLNNAYYVNNMLSAALNHQIGSRSFWRVMARYQINDYPEEVDGMLIGGDTWVPSDGIKRKDAQGELEIGVSYRVTSSMQAFVGYNYRERRSNMKSCVECDGEVISPFNFTDDRIVFRLEAGWL